MSAFRRQLDQARPDEKDGRRWLFVPYDQLTDELGPLADEKPGDLGIILVESPWKAGLRPYHKQKLALVLSNMRHFALEQARRGVAVRHRVADGPYAGALEPLAQELGGLEVREPAERELRNDLSGLVDRGLLSLLPHEGWLTTDEDFDASQDQEPPWRMDAFYRQVRQRTGVLMEEGSPVGGKYSFDSENREPWTGAPDEPQAPEPPAFSPDEITREVLDLVEDRFSGHPGSLDPSSLPASRRDAEDLWSWALEGCMEHFGTYEDAMARSSRGLFHTRLSPLLNLERLQARRVVDQVLESEVPLNSKEGFVRQVLGWREFVRHVHRRTDGFRAIPGWRTSTAQGPGNAGWSRMSQATGERAEPRGDVDGGSLVNHLQADNPLPAAYWGRQSGLSCLDTVVRSVQEEAYSHHITRLMVLSNIASLLDVSPRELTDWFWAAYADAYDWVVEPNVLGMGTFAAGDLMTTKPYVSGAPYIARMSDYCGDCAFDPKKDCPLTSLYWSYLDRHKKKLQDLPRMRLPLGSLKKRGAEQRGRDHALYGRVQTLLAQGEDLRNHLKREETGEKQ